MRPLAPTLPEIARHLLPHREVLLQSWIHAAGQIEPLPGGDIEAFCSRTLDSVLTYAARGDVEGLLQEEAKAAAQAARAGQGFQSLALAVHALSRCCLPFLAEAYPDAPALAEALLALAQLAGRRVEVLLHAQEEESARRLIEAQERAARAAERAREISHANEALRRSESQSQHRAEQIALLASVARKVASVLEPERLMEEAAHTIQARMNHTYVAVVVLDREGVLVGRWAGRPGVGRRSGGRAQGPPGGVIGRAIRLRAPQVVGEVSRDPDYHADVDGTRSEMVIPLLEDGIALGAIDFQSGQPGGFDLDDVAAGEALAEFLVVALRNARLFDELKRRPAGAEDRLESSGE